MIIPLEKTKISMCLRAPMYFHDFLFCDFQVYEENYSVFKLGNHFLTQKSSWCVLFTLQQVGVTRGVLVARIASSVSLHALCHVLFLMRWRVVTDDGRFVTNDHLIFFSSYLTKKSLLPTFYIVYLHK
jgi:hypothetical protein